MRTLAIDLGARRVGLALSDEGGRLATPYAVLQVTSPKQAIDLILPIIEKEGVERIVVGLPLNMDGSLGPAAKKTIDWARGLGKRVVFVDERLSTFAAEQELVKRKRSGEKITRLAKKGKLDALAAAIFLQEYLEKRLQELHPPL